MQTAAYAFFILVSAGTLAVAADAARPAEPEASTLLSPPTTAVGAAAPAHEAGEKATGKPRVEAPRHPDGHGRVCFNPADTRDKITTHRLAEPFRAFRNGGLQGEALRARLCRWKSDEFVYEISVLRRDGHITHVYMNAQNGQIVGGPAAAERK